MRVIDEFRNTVHPRWVRFAVGHANIELGRRELRFVVEGATDDALSDAEIGDYRLVPRKRLPWRPPVTLEVRARASHPVDAFRGTAGFGFWNAPGTGPEDVGAPPNAVWFFFNGTESTLRWAPEGPGHGWRAEVINGGTMPGPLMALGRGLLRVPGVRRLLSRVAQGQIRAAAWALDDVDWTAWHTYRLRWTAAEVRFWVDGHEVGRFERSPTVPLGFVAWVDNQRAVVTPDGKLEFGLVAVPQRQWLVLEYVRIEGKCDVKRG